MFYNIDFWSYIYFPNGAPPLYEPSKFPQIHLWPQKSYEMKNLAR